MQLTAALRRANQLMAQTAIVACLGMLWMAGQAWAQSGSCIAQGTNCIAADGMPGNCNENMSTGQLVCVDNGSCYPGSPCPLPGGLTGSCIDGKGGVNPPQCVDGGGVDTCVNPNTGACISSIGTPGRCNGLPNGKCIACASGDTSPFCNPPGGVAAMIPCWVPNGDTCDAGEGASFVQGFCFNTGGNGGYCIEPGNFPPGFYANYCPWQSPGSICNLAAGGGPGICNSDNQCVARPTTTPINGSGSGSSSSITTGSGIGPGNTGASSSSSGGGTATSNQCNNMTYGTDCAIPPNTSGKCFGTTCLADCSLTTLGDKPGCFVNDQQPGTCAIGLNGVPKCGIPVNPPIGGGLCLKSEWVWGEWMTSSIATNGVYNNGFECQ